MSSDDPHLRPSIHFRRNRRGLAIGRQSNAILLAADLCRDLEPLEDYGVADPTAESLDGRPPFSVKLRSSYLERARPVARQFISALR